MKNTIIKFFNLEPHQLHSVDVFSIGDESFALITLSRVPQVCPFCSSITNRVHDYHQRTLNHAILNGLTTTLVYSARRYYCDHCKRSFPEPDPFTLPGKRLSRFTILRIMQELKNPHLTFSTVAQSCSVSDTTVRRVFDSYVGLVSHKLPEVLCIDEVYTAKHNRRCFACVLLDFNTSQIYDLLPKRNKAFLANYFTLIPEEDRKRVKFVCMDMWEPYRDVCKLYFKNAMIVVDNFHVVKLISSAFNRTRVRVMKQFDKDSDEYYLLKKYNWLLNRKYTSFDSGQRIKLKKKLKSFYSSDPLIDEVINFMLASDFELEVAYTLKEDFNDLNTLSNSSIEESLDSFIDELTLYNLSDFSNVVKTMKNWRQEIINSFTLYNGRRVSNGPVESCNARIKLLKHNANGYTNFERFRKRVLYSLNKDSFINF